METPDCLDRVEGGGMKGWDIILQRDTPVESRLVLKLCFPSDRSTEWVWTEARQYIRQEGLSDMWYLAGITEESNHGASK